MRGQEGDLVAGRHVQHVDALAERRGDPHQPVGRLDRRLGVADLVVAGPVAGAGQRPAVRQPVFVLGVEGGAAIDVPQDLFDPLVVLHQQAAGRGAHEHLHAARPGQPLQLAEEPGVLVGAADVEGVVAVHAVLGPRQLVGQGVGVGGRGLGVRHLEHRHHAAQHRRARPGLQVFLPLQAGLAEVDLGVDDAGHHGQARGVEHLTGRRLAQVAHRGDLAVAHAHIGRAAAGVVHHLAAADDQVVSFSHLASQACTPSVVFRSSFAAAATLSTGRSIM